MSPDVETVIVGAGCAGLSLASALSAARVPGRVLLLEPRREYKRDRTWCFWDTEEQPFASAVSRSWRSWRVSCGPREVVRGSRHYRYCYLAGDDFYRSALAGVDRAEEQELLRGVAVSAVTRRTDGLIAVESDSGRVVARRVFDSRPPSETDPGVSRGRPMLLQRFLGWHVRAAAPCFDPGTVDLMHFLPADLPGRVRFLYLLPFSATEALVEMTYLERPELPEPDAARDLQAWLQKRAGSWEVLYQERGSLPMGTPLRRTRSAPGIHAIGIRGGRIKPSSGYAFLRIQRHSRAIARALREAHVPPAHAEPGLGGALIRGMDAVFLEALQAAPEGAPALFLRMFERGEPDALVRFLSEASQGPGERLRVAWSLPKWPMMRAALQASRKAMRAGTAPGPASRTAWDTGVPIASSTDLPGRARQARHTRRCPATEPVHHEVVR